MPKLHHYYVYIMASINKVIYVGVTNNLIRRVMQHRSDNFQGFSHKYKTRKIVYFEGFTDINGAIQREKELKSFRREKKVTLIEGVNPYWKDLYEDIVLLSKRTRY